MLFEIASITTQDEILLVSPHHQHAGANGYVLDRLKAILDRVYGGAHGALKAVILV